MKKPKYYLKPYWMALRAKYPENHADLLSCHGILPESWEELRLRNSKPYVPQIWADTKSHYYVQWTASQTLSVPKECLTKRLSMEEKDVR